MSIPRSRPTPFRQSRWTEHYKRWQIVSIPRSRPTPFRLSEKIVYKLTGIRCQSRAAGQLPSDCSPHSIAWQADPDKGFRASPVLGVIWMSSMRTESFLYYLLSRLWSAPRVSAWRLPHRDSRKLFSLDEKQHFLGWRRPSHCFHPTYAGGTQRGEPYALLRISQVLF